MLKAALVSSAGSALLSAFLVWWAVSGNWQARYNALQRDHAQAVAEAERRLGEQRDAASQAIRHIDTHYTTRLSDAHSQIDALRDDVAAGDRRLRIQAVCPEHVPADAGAAGVADGAGARLTDAAERHHWRLRERIETSTAMIEGLQAYALQCSGHADGRFP